MSNEVESRKPTVESQKGSRPPALDSRLHLSPNQRAWRRFRRNRPAAISSFFLGILLALVWIWPLLSHYKPDATSDAQFHPPSSQHWFGTDVHGRDLLVRTLVGARISLVVGAVGAFVSLIIGVSWGAVAGYVGGRTDNAMMRVVDILYALPSIIFVIVLKSAFERDLKAWLAAHFSTATASYGSMVLY